MTWKCLMSVYVLGSNNMNYSDSPTNNRLLISSIGVLLFEEG